MLKKLAVLIAALALSAPAFADRDHYRGDGYRGYGHGHYKHGHGHYGYGHRPVVQHYQYRPYYYRPAPRPVYVVERHHHVNPAAVLAGAVIGAVIVHHAVTGY